jgi:hypothetical protein
MDRDIGPNDLGLAGEHDVALDGVIEILDHRIGQIRLDAPAQGVSNIEMSSRNRDLHECEFRNWVISFALEDLNSGGNFRSSRIAPPPMRPAF